MTARWKTAWSLALAGCVAVAAKAQDDKNIVMDGSTTVGPIAKAFAEYYMEKNPDVNITVSESGSGNGAKSLINGACQIANMSRPMKDTEIAAAKEKGVQVVEHIVAMDGIAIAAHPSNPVKELSKEQLRAIFTGEISNWKELGGPDKSIVVISRDTNSGTYEAYQEMVMKSERITDKAEYVGSNGAVRQRVMSTEGAIGYVGLAFLEGVKALAINGVEPNIDTVTDRSYPISRPLFMYSNGEPADGTHLAAVLNICKTADGKKLVEEQGYVPLKD
ncbi:MAG: phosphate ABC transporter substrate-binding protein [Lentisphaerota bacterium]